MEDMKGARNAMNQDMNNLEVPALTLNPDERRANSFFTEPRLSGMHMSATQSGSGVSAGSVDESMLTPEEKLQVDNFVKQIDITNVKMVNTYGAGAQNSITAFSESITGTVRTYEFGNIGESLQDLRAAIQSTTAPEKKGIFGLFQKGKQKITYMISSYESAETNIKKIEKDLQQHRQVLTKDIYVFDQMYDQNLKFYKELTMYIIAGKKALEIARNTRLVELRSKAEMSRDQLDVQCYRDYEDACTRFEKRIFDLETTRLVCIQTAPQIRLLQSSNQEVADKLRSNIINTIPLWRNQMVLALGIEHTRRALDAQAAVTDMTNEMFRRNAEAMKQGAIDAATAAEKSVVDIETMRKVNADIITSINEVVRIHNDGARKRMEAQEELAKLENELKQALLEAGNRR